MTYSRKRLNDENRAIDNIVQEMLSLYMQLAEALEGSSDDMFSVIEQKTLDMMRCLSGLMKQAMLPEFMREAILACVTRCKNLAGKCKDEKDTPALSDELLLLGDDLRRLHDAVKSAVDERLRIDGTQQMKTFELLTMIVGKLRHLEISRILDYGCVFDRTGILGKHLIDGLSFEDWRVDGVLTSSENELTPSAVPNLYEHVFDREKAAGDGYDVILLLSQYAGDNSRDFLKKVRDVLKHGECVIFEFAPRNTAEEEAVISGISELGRFRIETEGEYRIVFLDRTIFDYTEQAAIYAVTHKSFLCPAYPMYHPIHAGSIDKEFLGYKGDHVGDNISALNPYINETTALYWIWKNDRHPFVGLNHYRRFFSPKGVPKLSDWVLTERPLLRIMEQNDVILGEAGYFFPMTTEQQLQEMFHQSEISLIAPKIMRQTIAEIQPGYLESYDRVMQGHFSYLCNLFVTKHDIMNAYCEWLFSFLLEALRRVNDAAEEIGGYINDHDRRIVGFLVERLMTVWFSEQHLRVKNMPIVTGGNQ